MEEMSSDKEEGVEEGGGRRSMVSVVGFTFC